jgi:hypothetical protein
MPMLARRFLVFNLALSAITLLWLSNSHLAARQSKRQVPTRDQSTRSPWMERRFSGAIAPPAMAQTALGGSGGLKDKSPRPYCHCTAKPGVNSPPPASAASLPVTKTTQRTAQG